MPGRKRRPASQFRKFVEATGYQTEAERVGLGQGTWKQGRYVQQNDDHPVIYGTWNDAKAFCDWLGRKESSTCRLATEAEWEYSCRAGTTTLFHSGDDEEGLRTVAHIGPGTAPVGSLKPNPWGLYDMHGNVWEWCEDFYGKYGGEKETDPRGPPGGPVRVYRGGFWGVRPRFCRSAYRTNFAPAFRWDSFGFRLARVVSARR
jgi:formylglycine-generating enzyme required for sulfatase activity